MGPSFAGTEIPSSAPTREETRTPSSLEGGVTGFRPGECWMRVGHGYLCRGSIPLCRAGTGGLLFFSEKKGPPPCATSSFCRLCTCLAGPSGKVGSCGIGDAGDYGGWQCRSSFRSAPSTLSHHKKTRLQGAMLASTARHLKIMEHTRRSAETRRNQAESRTACGR